LFKIMFALESRFKRLLSTSAGPKVINPSKVVHGFVTTLQPCEVCCNLRVPSGSIGSGKVGGDRSFLRNKEDFSGSARQGCRWCMAVAKALESMDLDIPPSHRIIVIIFGTGACYLKVPSAGITLQFYTPIGSSPAWDGITQGHEMSCSADMSQTASFIRSCLNACDSGHALCKQSTLRMPTRVIDVGRTNDSQVRLIETARIRASPYVALSYCWGRKGHLLTTQTNFRAMTTGIHIAEFPQTIQDAVEITRKLNLRYLWVDALCIIQDSRSDWEVESAKMASVYHNAYLTIAAGTSTCASEGFLHQKHLATAQRQPLRMDWRTDRGQPTVLAVRIVPAMDTHSYNIGGDRQKILPLNVRGWTLQEELLSHRTVTYTQNELWWTCQTQRNCECHTFDAVTTNAPKTLFSPALMANPPVAFEQWRAIVSEFSTRRLSYGLDKLPALSGLASVIHEKTGSSYVAGLWKDNFVRDLNWYSPARTLDRLDDANVKATEGYCAPTYSWASANGLIDFFRGSFAVSHPGTPPSIQWIPRSSLVDAKTVVDGSNPLGRVKSGYATLHGHISQAMLEVATTHMGGLNSYALYHNGEFMNFHPDMRLEKAQAGSKRGLVSVCRSPARSKAQPLRSGLPVLLFYLGDWSYAERKLVQRTYLVLGRCPLDMSKYERLGLAHHQTQLGLKKAVAGSKGLADTITLL
ncbi:heterokaryon incompatibility protein, partial [Colletotrichum incanum]